MMATVKTLPNDADVSAFLQAVEDENKLRDSLELVELLSEITGKPPKMWGTGLVGFGSYHYKYASGREGDWPLTAFSPRKQNLTIYIMPGFSGYQGLMQKLGKHKTGKTCLYITRLDDIDRGVLRELVDRSVADMREKYETN